jgi:hypothetical protein
MLKLCIQFGRYQVKDLKLALTTISPSSVYHQYQLNVIISSLPPPPQEKTFARNRDNGHNMHTVLKRKTTKFSKIKK